MEREIIADGGVQYVPQITAVQQIIYLDIDGASTNYNGEILTVENVEVQDSGLSAERIEAIAAALNSRYADKNILFVTEKPEYAEYSTIYIGKTGSFSEYGNFTGLAETLDESNQNKTDQAFVMLDATSTNEEIAEIIAHEAEHITGQLNHGGEGLNAYAATTKISSGITSSHLTISKWNSLSVLDGGTANSITISSGYMHISSGGVAYFTYAGYQGFLSVSQGGIAYQTSVGKTGSLSVSNGGIASQTQVANYGSINVYYGGMAESNILGSGALAKVNSGGVLKNTTVAYGAVISAFAGTVQNTTVSSGGSITIHAGAKHQGVLYIESGAVVSAYSSSIIDFTVAERTPKDGFLITNLSLIKGSPSYTITVSPFQTSGTYKLAQGAGNVSNNFTIGEAGGNYTSISIPMILKISNRDLLY